MNLKRLLQPLSGGVRTRFDARYEIVQHWHVWFRTVQPMRRSLAWHAYASAYNTREFELSDEVRGAYATVSPRSVQRWVLHYEREGAAGLIDAKDGHQRRGVNGITSQPALEKTLLALLVQQPTLKIRHLVHLLVQASVDAQSAEVLFTPPSYGVTYRFVRAWRREHASLYMAATDPDAWKNRYMSAFGQASADVLGLNERWEMDSTPADWMLTDEDGRERRYCASVVLDVYSRRMRVVLAPTPKTQTHQYALRQAILAWGVPQTVLTDHGRDYQSRAFVETLKALGIEHRTTAPFSPWQKPHVERGIQSLLHSILEGLSSFIGHHVAERSAIEARQSFRERLFRRDEAVKLSMPATQLRMLIEQWLRGVYERRVHAGLGISPQQRASEARTPIRRIEDVRALDLLLAAPAGKGQYTVTKKGLRIYGAQYIAPELGLVIGQRVNVRITSDWGEVVVYGEGGGFVCVARNPERSGISREQVARMAKRQQREYVSAQMRALKRPKVCADALVRQWVAERAGPADMAAPSGRAPVSMAHTTLSLQGAAHAAQVLSEGDWGAQGAMPRASAAVPRGPVPATPDARLALWLALDAQRGEGDASSHPVLQRWWAQYPQTPEFVMAMRKHKGAQKDARVAMSAQGGSHE
ncbi:DDE-type integrase/transposase/recombinase [Pandoraea apista]|uniref:DDE-type integrase/transposase/recombinase n=1 Tax=Pandoraea apista TaxID=93218 RepID=UPI0021ADDDD1|nr:DDE-type integrase/transposase/recombinase [Pandoraea apista]